MNNENIAVLIPVKSSVEYNNKWVLSDLYLFFCGLDILGGFFAGIMVYLRR